MSPQPTRPGTGGAPHATVVWIRHATLSARARRELERLVEVAINIADRDGLSGLTMRRLAADADTGTTTLYRYFHSRDELLELMADAAHASNDLPERPSGDWRADFSAIARAMRGQYLRHPWLPTLFVTIGPHTLRVANLAASVALTITKDAATADTITSALQHFVRGAAVGEIAEHAAAARSPLDTQDRTRAINTWIRAVIDNPDYPAFAELKTAGTNLSRSDRFEFGLARLLDGIEEFLNQAPIQKPPTRGT